MSVERAERDLQRVHSESDALRVQLSQLEQQAVKIANYIELARVYGEGRHKAPDARDESQTPMARSEPATLPANVRAVVGILQERRKPTPTKVLVQELAARGIQIGGRIPVTNLSSAMSRFKGLFRADRSEGWSLVEWDQASAIKQADAAQRPAPAPSEEDEDPRDIDLMRDEQVMREAEAEAEAERLATEERRQNGTVPRRVLTGIS